MYTCVCYEINLLLCYFRILLTLQHHILEYAERFPMFLRGNTFLNSIDSYTRQSVSMAVDTLPLKIRFEQTGVGVLHMTQMTVQILIQNKKIDFQVQKTSQVYHSKRYWNII